MEPNPYEAPTIVPAKAAAVCDGEPVFFAVTWLVSALAAAVVAAIVALALFCSAVESIG
jgi:hypothetical protein